ncbi:MAG: hypothetical protein KA783_05885, partial [Chitinophagales bacterium]|nr:hypothetical protein [Chitinophagales bacterium]
SFSKTYTQAATWHKYTLVLQKCSGFYVSLPQNTCIYDNIHQTHTQILSNHKQPQWHSSTFVGLNDTVPLPELNITLSLSAIYA